MVNATAHFAQAFKTGSIRRDHTIEFVARFGFLKKMIWIQELVFLRIAVFVPTQHLFALVFEGERQAQLRPHAIAVRSDMTDDAEGAAFLDSVNDAVDDFRVWFHWQRRARRSGVRSCKVHETVPREGLPAHSVGLVFSSSSMICRTRFPRAIESSTRNLRVGVYFSTTARATRP